MQQSSTKQQQFITTVHTPLHPHLPTVQGCKHLMHLANMPPKHAIHSWVGGNSCLIQMDPHLKRSPPHCNNVMGSHPCNGQSSTHSAISSSDARSHLSPTHRTPVSCLQHDSL